MMAVARFEAECPGASKVFLVGDFNNWDPEARRMKRVRKGEDAFVALVELEPGRQEFKFVVDGEWRCCPNSPRVPNDQGTENSAIDVSE